MATELPAFQVGDPVLIVDSEYDGELGTVLGISADGKQYMVVLENGARLVVSPENLSHRY
jgi:hypothetical protein